GFLRWSDAVDRLAAGMWGGLRRPVPVQTVKQTLKRVSIGSGPRREHAARCFRAAALNGELAVYVVAGSNNRGIRRRRRATIEPVVVPTSRSDRYQPPKSFSRTTRGTRISNANSFSSPSAVLLRRTRGIRRSSGSPVSRCRSLTTRSSVSTLGTSKWAEVTSRRRSFVKLALPLQAPSCSKGQMGVAEVKIKNWRWAAYETDGGAEECNLGTRAVRGAQRGRIFRRHPGRENSKGHAGTCLPHR